MEKSLILKSIGVITAMLVLSVVLCSCKSTEEIRYYSEKDNYISVTGEVSHIEYNEDFSALYIDVAELSPVLEDTCFKIVGENLKVVQANKVDDKLRIGMQIEFITAPKYFGDGYVMPIVALTVSGEMLLEFEEGYENFITWLS